MLRAEKNDMKMYLITECLLLLNGIPNRNEDNTTVWIWELIWPGWQLWRQILVTRPRRPLSASQLQSSWCDVSVYTHGKYVCKTVSTH